MTSPISPKRILVVDDEPLILSAMEGLLRFDGHSVEAASDGESALEKLAIRPFDLVFTDLAMPSMSGDALAIAIKKQYPQQIIILLTGSAGPQRQKGGAHSCADFILYKPFHMRELREVVNAIALSQAAEAPASAVLAGRL